MLMRYKSFRIRNFKGIKDTTVRLDTIGSASVFAFVGLNESGKTTVLEAIHSFSPDAATSELLGGDEGTGVPIRERVPRHLISSFTGDVSVTAVLSLSEQDKSTIAESFGRDSGRTIEHIPDEVVFERQQRFANGDFVRNFFTLRTPFKTKTKSAKKWRDEKLTDTDLRDAIYRLTPDIAYFPTLVFDFPKTIFLTNRGSAIDRFYRRVFQDILDYDGKGHTINRDIVGRVRSQNMILPWLTFLGLWGANEDRPKIQHVMDRAGAAVTKLVFGRWNKIFGEDVKGKEVLITYDILEGETEDSQGTKSKTEEHDVSVKFQIRDGTRRFDVNDRSLGFRWFFAFMLFTQFRVARSVTRPLLFLFDEPASNLHAAAQQKLIDSFPEIATGEHSLAYSTHSHYMIEPKWLEQTFIVTNRSDTPVDSVLDDISLDDESLDIRVSSYRSFVNQHPSQTSYFQPILDRLNVVPSRFDLTQPSIIVEGKSDYYILRYASRACGRTELAILPAMGAGTFGALAALHVGWNLNFLFVLDGDSQGKAELKRYQSEFGISKNRLATIDEFVSELKVIEDLLDDDARKQIQMDLDLSKTPTKGQIRRYFQEKLASDVITNLSEGFLKRANDLLSKLEEKFEV